MVPWFRMESEHNSATATNFDISDRFFIPKRGKPRIHEKTLVIVSAGGGT